MPSIFGLYGLLNRKFRQAFVKIFKQAKELTSGFKPDDATHQQQESTRQQQDNQ